MFKAVIAIGFVAFLAFMLYAMLTAGADNPYRR